MKAHEHMGSGGQETITDTDNSKKEESGDQKIKENREYQKCYSKKKEVPMVCTLYCYHSEWFQQSIQQVSCSP